MTFSPQVLDVLQNMGCPKPIAVSEEPVLDSVPEPGKKKNKKNKKKVKAETQKKHEKSKSELTASKSKAGLAASSSASSSVYKAGDFRAEYSKFVSEQRKAGQTHKQALQAWVDSSIRCELLKGMSPAERKRRRFDA